MANDPIDLDEHRGAAAQEAIDLRRQRLHEFQLQQEALNQQQEKLEKLLLANSAESWLEAGAKAIYLIELLATTSEGQEPRRKDLIDCTLQDLARLCERESKP